MQAVGAMPTVQVCFEEVKGTPYKEIWVRVLVALHIFLLFAVACTPFAKAPVKPSLSTHCSVNVRGNALILPH